MAKETYYFSHDSNALTDTKILNMRADYGLEGYGLFWVLIEAMRNEEDYTLSLDKNTYRAIKTLTNTNIDIEKFVKDCIEDYKLFEKKDGKFYSNSLLKRMEIKDKKSAIAKEKAQKRWNSNATDMQQQCSSNANKIKESKEKENKINKNKSNKEIKKKTFSDVFKENQFSSDLENVLKDFIDMRKAIKKPMTTKALELLIKNLNKLTNLEEEKIAILNQSIEHSWQTVYPLKTDYIEKQGNAKEDFING